MLLNRSGNPDLLNRHKQVRMFCLLIIIIFLQVLFGSFVFFFFCVVKDKIL